ncbi:MAG: tRNA pseudouridine(55) synthase TruB [Pirellulales bacterium]|nr:tRNA pseudouridine(55) synthase TruB [Pirellulales bacterium]
MAVCGLLNLNKPGGMTSRAAINRLQRLLPKRTRVGHAGTLDPLASGVLIAAVGPATRLIDYVQRMPKCYSATFLLGRRSPTEDTDGPVEELADPPVPTRQEIVAAAGSFVGQIQQRPPDFSALKVKGRRAYDLARAGKKVDLAARPVEIYRLDVVAYDYPELTVEVGCGSGTYVRSLGRDLARSLGTEAVMSALTRTAIGHFTLGAAVDPTVLDETSLAEHLLSPLCAVVALPRITLSADELTEIHHGRTIAYRPPATDGSPGMMAGGAEMAAVDPQGRLAAILIRRGENRLGPVRNFPSE